MLLVPEMEMTATAKPEVVASEFSFSEPIVASPSVKNRVSKKLLPLPETEVTVAETQPTKEFEFVEDVITDGLLQSVETSVMTPLRRSRR